MVDKVIIFENIKSEIIDELNNRGQEIGISEPVTLVEGFLSQPFSTELSTSITLGGPTIPMIMLLGNKTGRVYLFALKAIIKSLEL